MGSPRRRRRRSARASINLPTNSAEGAARSRKRRARRSAGCWDYLQKRLNNIRISHAFCSLFIYSPHCNFPATASSNIVEAETNEKVADRNGTGGDSGYGGASNAEPA